GEIRYFDLDALLLVQAELAREVHREEPQRRLPADCQTNRAPGTVASREQQGERYSDYSLFHGTRTGQPSNWRAFEFHGQHSRMNSCCFRLTRMMPKPSLFSLRSPKPWPRPVLYLR